MMNETASCAAGAGRFVGSAPIFQSRFIAHDDLTPDDFASECPGCKGTGKSDADFAGATDA